MDFPAYRNITPMCFFLSIMKAVRLILIFLLHFTVVTEVNAVENSLTFYPPTGIWKLDRRKSQSCEAANNFDLLHM